MAESSQSLRVSFLGAGAQVGCPPTLHGCRSGRPPRPDGQPRGSAPEGATAHRPRSSAPLAARRRRSPHLQQVPPAPGGAATKRCAADPPGPSLGAMLLAEDLLLLLTDDASGKLLLPAEQVDIALGGANLLELTLVERVSLDEEKHVVVFDPSSTGDPILDGALGVIGARQGRKPKAVVEPLGENLRTTLYVRLVDEGVLRAEERKVLGILPVHRWPAARAEHEERMRAQLTQVLVQGTTPGSRTAALVSLLHALNSVHRIVDPKEHGLTRKELQTRAEEVSPGDWASEAVREAIEAVMAAVIFGDQVRRI